MALQRRALPLRAVEQALAQAAQTVAALRQIAAIGLHATASLVAR